MTSRMNYVKAAPEVLQAMLRLSETLLHSGLDEELVTVITLRASQINGCAYCIDMHWKDLRALGESEQRLYALDAWRESPFYSPREQAELAGTEPVTRVPTSRISDAAYDALRPHFTDKEVADLTLAAATI